MTDRVHACQRPRHGIRVPYVPPVLRQVEGHRLMAAAEELGDDVRADEARASSHKYAHAPTLSRVRPRTARTGPHVTDP
ncbi:hypothetical protein Snoj_36450 [Streptomyces nojiriensis]|uniref:Uncharacterized protein n=1 Tax=Streptomyces nojiriensis TaxID=66374 RepID=A0ABQ3SNV3_9ACTN|nr:hypothetical protein GCM10010205_46820 [Streptomyces nojiriensis]GHI69727.1 hypothetical protein Snoj_36450 [Streptomyces nojiriensis]